MKRDVANLPGHKRSIVLLTVGYGFALLIFVWFGGLAISWLGLRSSSLGLFRVDRAQTTRTALDEHSPLGFVSPTPEIGTPNAPGIASSEFGTTSELSSRTPSYGNSRIDDSVAKPGPNDDTDTDLFAAIERLERQMAAAIAKARESVVALEYTAPDTPPDIRRVATGIVISQRGDVLSINIDPPPSSTGSAGKSSNRIVALDVSGRRHSVRWVATDPETGLTLLRLAPRSVRPIRPAGGIPHLGSQAFVVGNPFGMGHSVSRGHVAGLDRALDLGDRQLGGLIQVQVPLYPGDSGAAVVNLHGDWLGLIRSGLASTPSELEQDSNTADAPSLSPAGVQPVSASTDVSPGRPERDTDFGFAIPVRDALWVADQLRTRGRVDRAYLGVRLQTPATNGWDVSSKPEQQRSESTSVAADSSSATPSVDPHSANHRERTSEASEGALVHEVLTGSPASQAGLQPGDRIFQLDNQSIRTPYDLIDRLDRIPARATITLGIIRESGPQAQRRLVSMSTASRPQVAQAQTPTSASPTISKSKAPDPAKTTGSSSTGLSASDRLGSAWNPGAKTAASAITTSSPQPTRTNPSSQAGGDNPRTGAISLGAPLSEELRLSLPKTVVERLEKLEQRLEKLESHPEHSTALPASPPRPQIGPNQHP